MGASSDEKKTVPDQYSDGWMGALDGRTSLARNLRDRYDEVTKDLGGVSRLSYMQRSLIERAIWLEYWLADQERSLAKGKAFEVSRWVQAVNSLQGIFKQLGLERRERKVPSLQDYLGRGEVNV